MAADRSTLVEVQLPEDVKAEEQVKNVMQSTMLRYVPDVAESEEAVVKKILAAFVPDKNARLLDKSPNAASLEKMKNVIRHCVKSGKPIPILMAAAACKLPVHGHNLDWAEGIFIGEVLKPLQQRVQAVYAPGIDMVIRMEDLTVHVLFPDLPDLNANLRSYVDDFRQLIRKLRADSFVRIKTESDLMPNFKYFNSVGHAGKVFYRYLMASDPPQAEASPNSSHTGTAIGAAGSLTIYTAGLTATAGTAATTTSTSTTTTPSPPTSTASSPSHAASAAFSVNSNSHFASSSVQTPSTASLVKTTSKRERRQKRGDARGGKRGSTQSPTAAPAERRTSSSSTSSDEQHASGHSSGHSSDHESSDDSVGGVRVSTLSTVSTVSPLQVDEQVALELTQRHGVVMSSDSWNALATASASAASSPSSSASAADQDRDSASTSSACPTSSGSGIAGNGRCIDPEVEKTYSEAKHTHPSQSEEFGCGGVQPRAMQDPAEAARALDELHALGWKGDVSQAFRTFLRERYRVLYPRKTQTERDIVLANYLGCIMTRNALKANGADAEWEQHGRLEMGVVPPLPDTPEITTRVFYRSAPQTVSKTREPFWRCFGVVRSDNCGTRLTLIEHDSPLLQASAVKRTTTMATTRLTVELAPLELNLMMIRC